MTSRAKSNSPPSRVEISLSNNAMMSNTALATRKNFVETELTKGVEWCALRDLNVELQIIPQAIISYHQR